MQQLPMDIASLSSFARCTAIQKQEFPMKKHLALVALLASVSSPAFAQAIMDSRSYRTMAAQADAFEIASSQLALQRSRNSNVRSFAQNMIKEHSMTSQALNGGRPVYSASGEFIAGSLGGTLAGAGIGALVGGPVGAAVGAGVGAAAGTTAGAAATSPGASGSSATGALTGAGVGALVGGPVGAAVGAGVGATTGAAAGTAADVQTTGSVAPIRLGVPLSPEKTAMLNELASASGPQFDRLYGRYQRQAHEEALALHSNYAQNGGDPSLRQFAASVVPHIEHHLADTRRLPGATSRR
jgi:predicted outer membrane protein